MKAFHIPLTILKPIEITDIYGNELSSSAKELLICILNEFFLDILTVQLDSTTNTNTNTIDNNNKAKCVNNMHLQTTYDMEQCQLVFERLSTSKDCTLMKEFCLYYIQKHIHCIGIIAKTKKQIIKLLNSMSILDMVVKTKEEEEAEAEEENGNGSGSKKIKNKPNKMKKHSRENELVATMQGNGF